MALVPSYIGRKDLSIPAIRCIVCHFIGLVLSKSDSVWTNTNLDQEMINTHQKVTKRLIIYDSLKYRIRKHDPTCKQMK